MQKVLVSIDAYQLVASILLFIVSRGGITTSGTILVQCFLQFLPLSLSRGIFMRVEGIVFCQLQFVTVVDLQPFNIWIRFAGTISRSALPHRSIAMFRCPKKVGTMFYEIAGYLSAVIMRMELFLQIKTTKFDPPVKNSGKEELTQSSRRGCNSEGFQDTEYEGQARTQVSEKPGVQPRFSAPNQNSSFSQSSNFLCPQKPKKEEKYRELCFTSYKSIFYLRGRNGKYRKKNLFWEPLQSKLSK